MVAFGLDVSITTATITMFLIVTVVGFVPDLFHFGVFTPAHAIAAEFYNSADYCGSHFLLKSCDAHV